MNTPILRLESILLTSLGADMTDEEALRFQSDVLQKASETESPAILIDVSGLDVVDSFMARVISETVSMLHLRGTEAVVCGIQPAVALTLTEMGRELIGVEAALDLDHGMEKIREIVGRKAK